MANSVELETPSHDQTAAGTKACAPLPSPVEAHGHRAKTMLEEAVWVSLFIGCFKNTLFPQTGRAVVQVLERLGHQVEFPMAQTCCGQMHYNSGYRSEALQLMQHFANVFGSADVIVCPSSSCVSTVRNSYPLLASSITGEAQRQQIETLSSRVFELSEFLVDRLEVTDLGAYFPHRVTYHPTCNSLRALKISHAALQLLEKVRGLELVELPRQRSAASLGAPLRSRTPTPPSRC